MSKGNTKSEFPNFDVLLNGFPFAAYAMDVQGYYRACNTLLANILGLDIKDITGKKNADIPSLENFPDVVSSWDANNQKVIESGQPCEFQESLQSSDSLIQFKSFKIPYFCNNKVIGVIGFSIDISDQAEEIGRLKTQKAESEIALANILENLPGHLYWLDKNNIFLGCNLQQAKDFGLEQSSDVVGLHVSSFQSAEDARAIIENNRKILEMGEPVTAIEKFVDKNGEDNFYLSKKVPLRNLKREVIGLLGISFDITDRKKMEEDLRIAKEAAEAASHAKTEFIANMGHDIRTPLTGIIGFSRFLEEEIQDAEEKEYAQQIHQSGEQLLGLLNGVLDLITADSTNEDQVLHQPFDVRRVIQDVLELEKPAVKARHLEIKSNVTDDVPQYVVGDRMKLHRIILNLAGNAIKFTKEGHIELNAKLLELKDNTAMVEFAVKDTGIGIPEELQDKVFDRFFKVSPSYKGLYTGNGIGLHIAQKYVDLLHGEIRLTSQVGVGTTFSFVLPMPIGEKPLKDESSIQEPIGQQKDAAPSSSPSVTESPAINPKQPQVLLVEDNSTALNVLKMMVKRYPVQVHTAVDAESAFELVQNQEMNLIITDLGLPQKQGDELASQIRMFEMEQKRPPSTIVGLTGHALGEVTQACLKVGMNEVYRKPIEPGALKSLIEKLIQATNEKPTAPSPTPDTTTGSLGPDLPNTEEQLFQLDQHPILDLQIPLEMFGSQEVTKDILKSLKDEGIKEDLAAIKIAYEQQNWSRIEELAHKMKGGSTFGTVRLYYAFLYLERYRKAGHTKCSEQLYQQMLQVIDETLKHIDNWLSEN